jgi:hypothetical protein
MRSAMKQRAPDLAFYATLRAFTTHDLAEAGI